MALERLLDLAWPHSDPAELYQSLGLGEPMPERPYTVVNMVSTADGKTLQGSVGSSAAGLGSRTDQMLMRRIQSGVDGVVIGAGTLRPGNVVYDPKLWRSVITRSGDISVSNRFFTDAPEKALVFAPRSLGASARERLGTVAKVHLVGEVDVEEREVVRILRQEYGVETLALEGGATLNYRFFESGLVDEMFLSIAPKIKGGSHLPTVVDGEGFAGTKFVAMSLLSIYRDGNEIYLRYRVEQELA